MAAATVLGVFAHADTTLAAIRDLRARGFSDLTVYTPVPVEEIEQEIDKVRPLSKVRLFSVIGGLTGTATAFFLTIWTSLKWELDHGGQGPRVHSPVHHHRLRADHPLLRAEHPPRGADPGAPAPDEPSPTYDPRFTVDRFGVAVACPADKAEAVGSVLSSAGAEEVRR